MHSARETRIRPLGPDDAAIITRLVGELLEEIGQQAHTPIPYDLPRSLIRASALLSSGQIMGHLATAPEGVGLLLLYEGYALYAGGAFGVISELYVHPLYRNQGVGHALIAAAQKTAQLRHWAQLEVTTPPLPAFQQALTFYTGLGFQRSGGHKLRYAL